MHDVITLFASEYNATWFCDNEPNGDWGAVPKTGTSWLDPNATFSGLIQRLISKEYDIVLSGKHVNLQLLRVQQ